MNIKEIAKLAGVSTSTVSKIVNQKDSSISSETRERVLKIVKEYHYTPYASVTSPSQKTWVIGVILRSSTAFDAMLDGIVRTAQDNGYQIMVCNSCCNMDQELKILQPYVKIIRTESCGSRYPPKVWILPNILFKGRFHILLSAPMADRILTGFPMIPWATV